MQKNLALLHVDLPDYDKVCSRVQDWEHVCTSTPRVFSALAFVGTTFWLGAGLQMALAQMDIFELPATLGIQDIGGFSLMVVATVALIQLLYTQELDRKMLLRLAPFFFGVMSALIVSSSLFNHLMRGIPLATSLIVLTFSLGVPFLTSIALRPVFLAFGRLTGKHTLRPLAAIRNHFVAKDFPAWRDALHFQLSGRCEGDLSRVPFVTAPGQRGTGSPHLSYEQFRAQQCPATDAHR